jgi:hypothetical protein
MAADTLMTWGCFMMASGVLCLWIGRHLMDHADYLDARADAVTECINVVRSELAAGLPPDWGALHRLIDFLDGRRFLLY